MPPVMCFRRGVRGARGPAVPLSRGPQVPPLPIHPGGDASHGGPAQEEGGVLRLLVQPGQGRARGHWSGTPQ